MSQQGGNVSCDESYNNLLSCGKFKQMSLKSKWDLVKSNYLCNRCLKKHKRKYEKSIPCTVETCDKIYHPILHNHGVVVTNVNHHMNARKILFKIMPPLNYIMVINE